jgi:hypothetical protein
MRTDLPQTTPFEIVVALAFGLKRKSLTDAYGSAEIQLDMFGEALKEAA